MVIISLGVDCNNKKKLVVGSSLVSKRKILPLHYKAKTVRKYQKCDRLLNKFLKYEIFQICSESCIIAKKEGKEDRITLPELIVELLVGGETRPS